MTEHYTSEGTLLIRNSDIKDCNFEFNDKPIYLDLEFSKQNKSRMHQLGDVVTVHTGDVGTSAVITENEVNSIGFATIVTRPNKKVLDSTYLSVFLNTGKHKKRAIQLSTGDGRTNYNLSDYKTLQIPFQSIQEQKKIAKYFTSLNNVISCTEKKLKILKQIKKIVLQSMFPKNKLNKPDIRFMNFNNDWEQCKLKDVANIVSGGTPDTNNDDFWNGTINWFSPTEISNTIYVNSSQRKITELGLKKSSAKLLPKGTILFTSRATIGNTAILLSESTTNQGFQSIIPDHNKLVSYFVFAMSSQLKKTAERLSSGSTFNEISNKQMEKIEIKLPIFAEQQTISDFFESLDKIITLHERKIETLKKIKQKLLQNMFV